MATTTTEEQEKLLQFAIDFALTGTYLSLDELTSDKRKDKRAIHRKAATLTVEKGKVYLQSQQRRVIVLFYCVAKLFGLHLYYSVQLCCVPMSSA